MRQALILHPESRSSAVSRIEVEIARPRTGHLVLRYVVTGTIGDLKLPPRAAPARTDELWKHACFEAFVKAPHDPAYCELNFSPSTQWAAYSFMSYRQGMSAATEIEAPRIRAQSAATHYELEAALDLNRLTGLPGDDAWRLGLSAVIEETSGRLSYWALKHPPGRADFHHSDCFALELARA
jgi:hypothetical protein